MGIFTRFSDIVNSNINAILDKAEDPEKIVRLMIQEMEDTLVEVRSAAARSIADKKDLNRKIEGLEQDLNNWDQKAELALRKGREDLAKAALVEKSRVAAGVEVLKQDYHAVDEGLAKLNEDIKPARKHCGLVTRLQAVAGRCGKRFTTTRLKTPWCVLSNIPAALMMSKVGLRPTTWVCPKT